MYVCVIEKLPEKVFSVFGIACKNLYLENPATTVTTINPATIGHYKPNRYQPPSTTTLPINLKNYNQNQNTLISKSISKLIYQNPQTTPSTDPPPVLCCAAQVQCPCTQTSLNGMNRELSGQPLRVISYDWRRERAVDSHGHPAAPMCTQPAVSLEWACYS